MEHTVFIVNPVSGKKLKKQVGSVIRKHKSGHFADTEIVFTLCSGHATELVKEYLKEGVKRIIAVGGDGTINEVAKAMIGTEAAMGIIPMGSGNGLARHLNIPLDIDGALKVIENNNVACIDYGLVNEKPFFCTSGIGFDAHIGKLFAASAKRGFSSYFKITISEFFRYCPRQYELSFGGEKVLSEAFLVTFANASQYGNNAFIAPDANISDGLLNLVILKPFPLYASPVLAWRLFARKINKSKYIEAYTCNEVTVYSKKLDVFHFDGEPSASGNTLHVKIIPGGLKVIV